MRVVDNVRPDRQTVMFSATFPRQMEALARRILTKPVEVQVGGRSVVCKDVEQYVVSTRRWLVSQLEFNVPFQRKYGYIRDDPTVVYFMITASSCIDLQMVQLMPL